MNNTKTKMISFRVKESTYNLLQDVSKKRGLSVADIIRIAIRNLLKEE